MSELPNQRFEEASVDGADLEKLDRLLGILNDQEFEGRDISVKYRINVPEFNVPVGRKRRLKTPSGQVGRNSVLDAAAHLSIERTHKRDEKKFDLLISEYGNLFQNFRDFQNTFISKDIEVNELFVSATAEANFFIDGLERMLDPNNDSTANFDQVDAESLQALNNKLRQATQQLQKDKDPAVRTLAGNRSLKAKAKREAKKAGKGVLMPGFLVTAALVAGVIKDNPVSNTIENATPFDVPMVGSIDLSPGQKVSPAVSAKVSSAYAKQNKNLQYVIRNRAGTMRDIVDHYDGELNMGVVSLLIETNLEYVDSSADAEGLRQQMPGLEGPLGYEKSYVFVAENYPEALPARLNSDPVYENLNDDRSAQFHYLLKQYKHRRQVRKNRDRKLPISEKQLHGETVYEEFRSLTRSYFSQVSKMKDHLEVADFFHDEILMPDVISRLEKKEVADKFSESEKEILGLGSYNGGAGGIGYAIDTLKADGHEVNFTNMLTVARYRDYETRQYMLNGLAMQEALANKKNQKRLNAAFSTMHNPVKVRWKSPFEINIVTPRVAPKIDDKGGFTIEPNQGLSVALKAMGKSFPTPGSQEYDGAITVNKKIQPGDKVTIKDEVVSVSRKGRVLGQFSLAKISSKPKESTQQNITETVNQVEFTSEPLKAKKGVYSLLNNTDYDWESIDNAVSDLKVGYYLKINDGQVAVFNDKDEKVQDWKPFGA